jgi:hypothetical protein
MLPRFPSPTSSTVWSNWAASLVRVLTPWAQTVEGRFSNLYLEYMRSIGALFVTDFGATGNGTSDDRPAFQAAIEQAAANPNGGLVVVPKPQNFYKISKSIFMRSRVTLWTPDRNTVIHTAGDAPPPDNHGLMRCGAMFGSYTDINYDEAPLYALNDVSLGDISVEFATPADAADFVVDDVVAVRNTADAPNGKISDWVQMNVVTAVDTVNGTITLRHPINRSVVGVSLWKLTNTGIDFLYTSSVRSSYPNWAVFDAAVIGGRWTKAAGERRPILTNGAVDCLIDIDYYEGRSGPCYSNLTGYTKFVCPRVVVEAPFIEIASGSHDIEIEYGNARLTDFGSSDLIWIPHGFNNTIKVGSIVCEGARGSGVLISHGSNNTIEVGEMTGPSLSGAAVDIVASADYGERPQNNFIRIRRSAFGSHFAYIRSTGTSGGGPPYLNTIRDSSFFGPVTAISGIAGAYLLSMEANTLDNLYFENGGIYPNVGSGNFINNIIRDIKAAGTGANFNQPTGTMVPRNSISNVIVPKHTRQDDAKRVYYNQTSTSASPWSEAVTIPADTIRAGDAVQIEMFGRGIGTAGTKTVSILWDGSPIGTGTVSAVNARTWRLTSRIYVRTDGIIHWQAIYAEATGAPIYSGAEIAGQALNTNSHTLTFDTTVADPADSLVVVRASLTFAPLSRGEIIATG